MTAKRDTVSTCLHCGHAFMQDGIGRTRQYCGAACKTAACRERRRKQYRQRYAEISASHMESTIGEYEGCGDIAGGDALRRLATYAGLALDERRIDAASKAAQNLQGAVNLFFGFGNTPSVTKWDVEAGGRGVSGGVTL